MNENILVMFEYDAGRMGRLSGLLITTQAEIDRITLKKINFGEVLGKHSDISLVITPDMFTRINVSPQCVRELLTRVGIHISGINPFHYED